MNSVGGATHLEFSAVPMHATAPGSSEYVLPKLDNRQDVRHTCHAENTRLREFQKFSRPMSRSSHPNQGLRM
jgi:hypothetical protein